MDKSILYATALLVVLCAACVTVDDVRLTALERETRRLRLQLQEHDPGEPIPAKER